MSSIPKCRKWRLSRMQMRMTLFMEKKDFEIVFSLIFVKSIINIDFWSNLVYQFPSMTMGPTNHLDLHHHHRHRPDYGLCLAARHLLGWILEIDRIDQLLNLYSKIKVGNQSMLTVFKSASCDFLQKQPCAKRREKKSYPFKMVSR